MCHGSQALPVSFTTAGRIRPKSVNSSGKNVFLEGFLKAHKKQFFASAKHFGLGVKKRAVRGFSGAPSRSSACGGRIAAAPGALNPHVAVLSQAAAVCSSQRGVC